MVITDALSPFGDVSSVIKTVHIIEYIICPSMFLSTFYICDIWLVITDDDDVDDDDDDDDDGDDYDDRYTMVAP